MIDFVRVGRKISQYRKEVNFSQEELAAKLFVTRQAVSKWENGTSAPAVDMLFELCKLFKTTFEELLCLGDQRILQIDCNDIFKMHDRNYIIRKLIDGELNVSIEDVLYQFSPSERMMVLKAVKEKKLSCNKNSLWARLTISEQKYLGGKSNEIKKN